MLKILLAIGEGHRPLADGCSLKSDLGTLFELKRGQKLVGTSLCTYRAIDMEKCGPALEFIEVAKEWQYHGRGTALLQVLERHFVDIFQAMVEVEGTYIVRVGITCVTREKASRRLLKWGFRDDDGVGEERSKCLYFEIEAEDDDFEDEGFEM